MVESLPSPNSRRGIRLNADQHPWEPSPSGARNAVYDATGNLLTSTDGLLNKTTYNYDGQGQLATVRQPGNASVARQ